MRASQVRCYLIEDKWGSEVSLPRFWYSFFRVTLTPEWKDLAGDLGDPLHGECLIEGSFAWGTVYPIYPETRPPTTRQKVSGGLCFRGEACFRF